MTQLKALRVSEKWTLKRTSENKIEKITAG
jgi:hypothetical protein